jgi:hypothetical protein
VVPSGTKCNQVKPNQIKSGETTLKQVKASETE